MLARWQLLRRKRGRDKPPVFWGRITGIPAGFFRHLSVSGSEEEIAGEGTALGPACSGGRPLARAG